MEPEYYPNNTMSMIGLPLRELKPGLTTRWYHVLPVDLTEEGSFRYQMAVSNLYCMGCLDEVNIIILPMIDGNTKSAGLFDRPASAAGQTQVSGKSQTAFAPSGFKLADVQRLPGDGLWLKYTPQV